MGKLDMTIAEKKASQKDWERLFLEVYHACLEEFSGSPTFNPEASERLNARFDLQRVATSDLLEIIEKLCVMKEGWFYADRLLQIIEEREDAKWLKNKKNREALLQVMSETLPESQHLPLEDIENTVCVSEYEPPIRPDLERDFDIALESLTEKERAVIELCVYGKMNQSEVARKWGVSRQAVNKIYNNATEKLKKRLYKYAYNRTG